MARWPKEGISEASADEADALVRTTVAGILDDVTRRGRGARAVGPLRPLVAVYCATKHAIEGLTKAMAIDLAPHGIRVNSLGPTFLLTPMIAPFFANPEFRAETLARIPLGRLATVEDLMGAILFFASDASALMTGSALTVDGGWTAI